ncbi:MAG: sulfotransferase [Deltaproteobacteria bacterium]|nr:sulfotransferase [Deltaproteobacteria bacterium]
MSGVRWDGYRRFAAQLWRERGAAGVPEVALRGAMGLAWEASWALGRDADLPDNTVMIVGHQRSGTTLLHRLLAAHPAASSMPLHALVFPADAVQVPLRSLPRPQWLDRAQDRLLARMDPIHRVRLHEPEEDEFLLWALFRSPMNTLDRPWRDPPWVEVDDGGLAVYAQAVARSVRRTGLRHVGKNPHFTWRIPALRRALPGVRVVQLLRDPLQAIPSRLSLIRAIWRTRGLPALDAAAVERIYQSSLRTYLGGVGQADLDLSYGALVRDPVGVVRQIHERFGLEPVPEGFAGEVGSAHRRGPGRHVYALEEFGLSETRVRTDLEPIFERLAALAP